MKKYYFTILFSLLTLITSDVLAQTDIKEANVKVSGEVTKPLMLSLADMQQFKQNEVVRKEKDGKDHTYTGVILSDILKKAGVTLGKDLRGINLTKFVSVGASDGYRVVFALAELDKDFTDRAIILATKIDNKPLPDGDGPFRIIVQDEKRPARCIKMVKWIKVQFGK